MKTIRIPVLKSTSTRRSWLLPSVALSAGALVLAGCASDEGSDTADEGDVNVVATTTFWADITDRVLQCAGSGTVTPLMPVGADPHDFSASSQDAAAMVNADLVVANGLELEEGLESTIESAQDDGARVFELASQLNPVPFAEHAGSAQGHEAEEGEEPTHEGEDKPEGQEHSREGEEGEEDHHGGDDPHVWLDTTRAADAASLIGAELADATGNDAFADCGNTISEELKQVNSEVAEILASVPEDRRVLVTDHDAFGYFADAYGYKIAGVVVPGGSTLGDPSSAELAELTETINDAGVPAIFSNTADATALIEAVAAEAGEIEVVPLYVGSIGEPGSGADSYEGMVRSNAESIARALKG